MTPEEAEWLRKAWAEKRCLHATFTYERVGGVSTGDFYCTQCGKHFFADEVEELQAKRSGTTVNE